MSLVDERQFVTLLSQIEQCESCKLSTFRNKVVTYRGNPFSNIMIVGEAPGEQEDKQGLPMVGRSGSYLVSLFKKHGLTPEDFYITNVVMCRPPNNVDPPKECIKHCSMWLSKQIALIQPEVIITVGRISAQVFIPELSNKHITDYEGQVYYSFGGIRVIPIRHPSAILRNPSQSVGYDELIHNVVQKSLDLVKYPF